VDAREHRAATRAERLTRWWGSGEPDAEDLHTDDIEALSRDAALADEVFPDKAEAFHAGRYAGQVEYRRIVRERREAGRSGS
jgi:hypothetical protein